MSFLKRITKPAGEASPATLADPWFEGRFPAIWEYMTAPAFEDGAPRQTATLLFFASDGVMKVALNDKEANQTMWSTGEGIEDTLAGLESRLADGTGEWRKNTPLPKFRKK